MKKLERSFFERKTVLVAKELLGKVFVFGDFQGIISETEAYMGFNDPASHAARGRTPRNQVMFGPAGHLYVYFIYGMYHCLNFVTEKVGSPGGVLIRGIQLTQPSSLLLDGPGKICRALGICREHNGIDLLTNPLVSIACLGYQPAFQATSRIGIRKAQEKLWRFVVSH